jgi:hypothetical protein
MKEVGGVTAWGGMRVSTIVRERNDVTSNLAREYISISPL